jgi:hypothetical protein
MKPNVKVKVLGDREDVEQFLKVIEKTFALMLKSKLLPNSDGDGIHCYLDIDPYALREAQKH